MSRPVDKKIDKLAEKFAKVLTITDKKQGEFALECKIQPGTLAKALERSSFSDDIVDKIHDTFGVRKGYWEDGEQPIIDPNHTQGQKPNDNSENNGELGVYRSIFEGRTEYIVLPRKVLDGTQLMSVTQIDENKKERENDQKIIDRLLDQNEKLMERVLSMESQLARVQKGKQGA